MELKPNMYVRTKHNGIKKIVALYTDAIFTDNHIRIENKYILKASYNIIDLIEVGDYVNGYKVVDIKIFSDGNKYVVIATEEHQSFWKDKVFEDEIKSIVTSQQFESMSYKVGE